MSTTNGWNNNIADAKSAILLNSGTNPIGVSTDASATTVNIATGAAAKVATLGSTNGASSLALKYGTADFSLASATGNVIVALDTGEVTKPLQPAFLAYLSANVLNVTGDGTNYQIIFNSEIFDQSNNFNTGTGVFTAPVTGRYQFNGNVLCEGIAATHVGGAIIINTSNRIYVSYNANYFAMSSNSGANPNILALPISIFADMDVGDTAYMTLNIGNAGKTVDIYTVSAADPRTWFSGYLAC